MKIKQLLLAHILSFAVFQGFSQTKDTTKAHTQFRAVATLTNNGISLIPSFSLGKPAVLLLMSVARRRLSFDNDVRFSLDGKPWNFLFWERFMIINKGKFRLTTGANLSLNFRAADYIVNGITTKNMVVKRYVAGELVPNYFIKKNLRVGIYYLFSRGIDEGTIKNTHFITINASISQIKLLKDFRLRIIPQAYYLFQDGKEGYYFNSAFSFSKNNFPLSVSSIVNKAIHTNIIGSKDFVWNLSLVYSIQ